MYRFVGFFVSLVCVVISVKADAEAQDCYKTVLLNKMCCPFNVTDEQAAMIKECEDSGVDRRQSCDFDICFAQKAGYLFPNGTINMEAATVILEGFENYSDIKDIVIEKCMKAGNLEMYGAPGMCQLKKLSNCIKLHSLLNCPQWEDSERCSKVKDKIAECEGVYP